MIGTDRQGGRVPLGKLLIAGQMAFAVLLLLVAALFVRSLQALTRVDVGYDRDHVLVARIDPRSAGYDVTELPALSTRVIERLASLPGVVAVSMSANGPFSGSRSRGDFQVEGYTPGPQRTDDQAFRVGHVRLLPDGRPDDQAGPRLRTGGLGPTLGA